MAEFNASFVVKAPLARVAEFHRHPGALRRLTPPPLFVQFHQVEPLAEGSVAEFSLWFGPVPVRWRAIHTRVDPLHGFHDSQARGPMASWEHTHTFTAIDESTTRVSDEIIYAHKPGWRGLLSRLLFAPPMLRIMFAYRRWATRRAVENPLIG